MHVLSLDSTAALLFTCLKVCSFNMILNLRPSQLSSYEMASPVLNKYLTAEDKVSCSRTQHNVLGEAQ